MEIILCVFSSIINIIDVGGNISRLPAGMCLRAPVHKLKSRLETLSESVEVARD